MFATNIAPINEPELNIIFFCEGIKITKLECTKYRFLHLDDELNWIGRGADVHVKNPGLM